MNEKDKEEIAEMMAEAMKTSEKREVLVYEAWLVL